MNCLSISRSKISLCYIERETHKVWGCFCSLFLSYHSWFCFFAGNSNYSICSEFNWSTWGKINIILTHPVLLYGCYECANLPGFSVYQALKPWLNCALYCERGCLSEVKKCCTKSILLFLVAPAQISGCCQALTNRLCAINPSYQPVTLYGEDKSRQLKFKLLCALPWLPSFRVSLHLSLVLDRTASVLQSVRGKNE